VLPDVLGFAIVDEVDSILIDESRNPMIISQPRSDNGSLVATVDGVSMGRAAAAAGQHLSPLRWMVTAVLTGCCSECKQQQCPALSLHAASTEPLNVYPMWAPTTRAAIAVVRAAGQQHMCVNSGWGAQLLIACVLCRLTGFDAHKAAVLCCLRLWCAGCAQAVGSSVAGR
jgi:hypothetical protein